MKNRNTLSIAIIFCLSLIAYLFNNNEPSIIRSELRDFSISDTSQIAEINITSKEPETVNLKRVDEKNWLVNEKFKASKSSIFYLLKTLQRMEVAYPVPISLRDNVLGNLAVKGLKVDVLLRDGAEKTIYVGSDNKELTATYMMIKDASDPYAVHIPGFRGFLSSRFFTNEYLWRDKTVMNYKAPSISSIKMMFYSSHEKDNSFQIDFDEEGYVLKPLHKKDKVFSNPLKVKAYRNSFQNLFAETFVMKAEIERDSLTHIAPIFNLTVKASTHETQLKVFYKKADDKAQVKEDRIYDPERLYACVNDKDWMIIQKHTFKNVIKKLNDFK